VAGVLVGFVWWVGCGGGWVFQVGDLSNSMITKQQKYNLSNRFATVKKLLCKE